MYTWIIILSIVFPYTYNLKSENMLYRPGIKSIYSCVLSIIWKYFLLKYHVMNALLYEKNIKWVLCKLSLNYELPVLTLTYL